MNPIDEFNALTSLFPEEQPLVSNVEYIPASTTPEPYKTMLVHEHHMTVTMENYHGCAVDVRIIDRHLEAEQYRSQTTQ